MGNYNSNDLRDIIMYLKDAIINTTNLNLALCWIVELFVAIQAHNSGRTGTFTFKT